jgi:kynurenine formamidase
MTRKPATITVEGLEMLEKTANLPKKGSSCVIYLPPEWKGKRVMVVRIE